MKSVARQCCALGAVTFAAWGVYGAHGLYEQHHLTAGMRRSLAGCVSMELPPEPPRCVLSSVEAQVRTRRDERAYLELQRALQLIAAADGAGEHIAKLQAAENLQLKDAAHSEQLMQLTQRAYISSHLEISNQLDDDISVELERRERARTAEKQTLENEQLLTLQERLEARVQWQQLRTELGLAQGR